MPRAEADAHKYNAEQPLKGAKILGLYFTMTIQTARIEIGTLVSLGAEVPLVLVQ